MAGGVEEAGRDQAAPKEEILRFLGVDACRLAFRYYAPKQAYEPGNEPPPQVKRCVLLLDCGEDEPEVRELGAHRAMKPLLSPDGSCIVYNMSFRTTEIYVRSLEPQAEPVQVAFGATPRWWSDSETGDTFIIYRTDIGKGKWPDHSGETLRLKINLKNLTVVGQPEKIYDRGFSGGLSPDGRWLSTGYHTLDMVDLWSGEHYPLLRDGQSDNDGQVCSISSPPDNSGRVMQLRLPHDRFGIVRYDGTGDDLFWLPEGAVEWQTPEWSNHPDYCVAVASNRKGRYEVYLVRISDHEMMKVVWGQSYMHPCLWCVL